MVLVPCHCGSTVKCRTLASSPPAGAWREPSISALRPPRLLLTEALRTGA